MYNDMPALEGTHTAECYSNQQLHTFYSSVPAKY